jgi:PAS domain S-box-containing protein
MGQRMETRAETASQTQEAPAGEQTREVAQAELEAILNHASVAVAIYEAVDDGNDFIFVEFNQAAEEVEHISRAEVIGKSVLEVFPGVKEFGLFDVFQRVWRTGQAEHLPVSMYRDARLASWRRNYVCKLPNGQIMAVYEDVTRSKQSELATRMSEQRFRAIANYTYDWEVWVGPAGQVLWMNPAAEKISGYSLAELFAMRDYPAPLVYEADRERMVREFQSAVKGSTGNEQFRLVLKDGRIIWVEMSWQPIYDDRGNPLGHRESIRDVTARRLAEQAAQLAEQEKESILDNMAEQIIHLDADGSILWANRSACESVGMTREQVIGHLCDEVPVDWHETWGKCPAAEAMETGERIEAEKSSPDGRTWLIQAAPVRDAKGRIIGAVEIALDVTRYKQAEEALQEMEPEAQEMEAGRSEDDPAAEET